MQQLRLLAHCYVLDLILGEGFFHARCTAGLRRDIATVFCWSGLRIASLSGAGCRIKAACNDASIRDVEVNTVDGFQGREKGIIVISAVRSNATHQVGFLADERRMNVAVTRARRQCILVCNSETLQADKFLSGLVEHFQEHGLYKSAQELVP